MQSFHRNLQFFVSLGASADPTTSSTRFPRNALRRTNARAIMLTSSTKVGMRGKKAVGSGELHFIAL